MHSSALFHAERAVPRYTSYPTAPHFSGAIGASEHAQWLAALPDDATLSLYLHIPFCHSLCYYCGCTTKATRRPAPVAAYAARLEREIGLVAAAAGGRAVTHIAWGGGTPSLIGPEALKRLFGRINDEFDLTGLIEHAIELDPRETDAALADALGAIGVDRVSFGVQDFSVHVQSAIGRVQPFGTVERAVKLVREAGVSAVNLDLMYGLPHQTERDVRRTAQLATLLAPERLALFGYAHVPWVRPNQKLIDQTALPGAATRLDQAEAARAVLVAAGYVPVGLDHFARPHDPMAVAAAAGRLHRNFQGYTVDAADALIGLGASAISRLPQGFTQNAPDSASYIRAIDAGRFSTVRGIAFTPDDVKRGALIERLMCDLAVDLDAYTLAEAAPRLAPLVADGLLEIEGKRIAMTSFGRPFVRLAAAALDARLQAGARHSVAV
ncbi:oxygen-independent coproporphyrinogen III oxidase [Ancylobacter sp. SL191]|uniref:oxygen-independent coproporphyrinogen III oxidase n=1 Tax=Ancylobacter sp. SL191 TaxID=2995166 RepID=UPI00226E3674|nr:oxygen-independent coproporphyrinogen III oxidase [Ancylobacter sp. SL191]WAC27562.1 oxygen-independent coproporphyrinogen III oxidase [Ancylobacter sp. SL191]